MYMEKLLLKIRNRTQSAMVKLQLLLIIILFHPILSFGQIEMRENSQFDLPHFSFSAFSYKSDSTSDSRVDIYIQIEYAALKFVKSENEFVASYEAQISFFDSANSLIYEKQWANDVHTPSYEKTTSSHILSSTKQTFLLSPRLYIISLQIRDLETRKLYRVQKELNVISFLSSSENVSDVMLLDPNTKQEGKQVIFPNISNIITSERSDVTLFFETYVVNELEKVKFSLQIKNNKGEEVLQDSIIKELVNTEKQVYYNISSLSLPVGEYYADFSAQFSHSKQVRHFPLSIRWKGLPESIVDIDEAVSQLLYIAKTEEIDSLQEKSISTDERRKRFDLFWKHRDPTPNTPRNELMEEYYNRLDYSNKNFGHHSLGWRTDRGMVYVIFGTPDNVERHPFDIDSKPYEIWYYYELNKKFTFVDETGFGDFRLTTPLYEVWGKGKQ